LPIKSWFFTFFHFFFLLMVLHDVTFNVTNMIWIWSFWFISRIFTRSIVLKFGVKILVDKNNSRSLILTNLELKFEACMLNLIWKWGAKDPRKDKEVRTRKDPQKKNFDIWMLLSPRSHGMRRCNFWRLMFNKVTSRSYNYFLKFSYFFW
jgi:hypothetical protein